MAEGWRADSTFYEDDDGYWIERGVVEDPSLCKDDYIDAARINRSLIQPTEDTPPW